ncbi:hypothetical protein ACNJYA_00650 [Bradyrhizobium sp. DASA03068]|uniref:hypothetical protein n=1 Tax=Bradyrhizobium sp. BLXBL-01 TaxID=3395915 RepID=UPI003F716986
MTPLEFLKQQSGNVERALSETLRYDYGPSPTREYYRECCDRLERIKEAIKTTRESDLYKIQARLDELSGLSVWISLIERSRLGEFSWPFAEALRKMAETLLADTNLLGSSTPPIVHIVSDGEGYLIHYEGTSPSSKNKFAFIAFPKPLKHHVLLHSLFGHELGHTALHTVGAGTILQKKVMSALQSHGPLSNAAAMTAWLHDNNAPQEIKIELRQYEALNPGVTYRMNDFYLLSWIDEFICDLFGLILFGPGFAAAHKFYLSPTHPNPYEFAPATDPTHPPYAMRDRLIVKAIQLLGWDKPVTSQSPVRQAEQELLNYIHHDSFAAWCTLLSDAQLQTAIDGIQEVFARYGQLGYVAPTDNSLTKLVLQLQKRLPPIIAELGPLGEPILSDTSISHTLYAGWIYSLGHKHLTTEPLSFLQANMLCDQALLQQRAIAIAILKKMK